MASAVSADAVQVPVIKFWENAGKPKGEDRG